MTRRLPVLFIALVTLLPAAASEQSNPAIYSRPVQFGSDFKSKTILIPGGEKSTVRTADCPTVTVKEVVRTDFAAPAAKSKAKEKHRKQPRGQKP